MLIVSIFKELFCYFEVLCLPKEVRAHYLNVKFKQNKLNTKYFTLKDYMVFCSPLNTFKKTKESIEIKVREIKFQVKLS